MSQSRQFCTFFLKDFLFGIEVSAVQEILRYQTMTTVPLAPDWVHGLINLRGQIVTAIDLRLRLNLSPLEGDTLPTNIIVRTADGAVSILIDEIGEVIEVDPSAFEPTPENLDAIAREVVAGVYKLEGGLLLVLDVARAVSPSALQDAHA